MLRAGVSPHTPTIPAILHYAQLLPNSFANPTSVKNYLSGAKTFIVMAGGDPSPFDSPLCHHFFKGAARISSHVPNAASEIDLSTFKSLCDTLWNLGPDARITRAALLFGYVTFLRQSNFLLTTPPSPHMIRRQDIRPAPYGLAVHVPSTKTLTRAQSVIIPVHRSADSRYCPVAAYMAAKAATPAGPLSPLFVTTTGCPLTVGGVTGLLRMGLRFLNWPLADRATVHSCPSGSESRRRASRGDDPWDLAGGERGLLRPSDPLLIGPTDPVCPSWLTFDLLVGK